METGSWKMEALGGLWGGFCRYGVPLETCLGDLGGLLWIHGYFFGHLGASWCDFGIPLGGFWEPSGSIWKPLGDQGLFVFVFLSENVKL